MSFYGYVSTFLDLKAKHPYQCCFQMVLDAVITGWVPKIYDQINEKQLRRNIIYPNLRRQSPHCNCI